MAARTKKPPRIKQTLFKLRAEIGDDPAKARAFEIERLQRYKMLFSSPLGMEVLADFLATIGFFSVDLPGPEGVANYRNGARWAGGELLRAMGADEAEALTRAIIHDDLSEVFNEDE